MRVAEYTRRLLVRSCLPALWFLFHALFPAAGMLEASDVVYRVWRGVVVEDADRPGFWWYLSPSDVLGFLGVVHEDTALVSSRGRRCLVPLSLIMAYRVPSRDRRVPAVIDAWSEWRDGEAPLLGAPTYFAEVVAWLPSGTSVQVLGEGGVRGFLEVETVSGMEGWVPASVLAPSLSVSRLREVHGGSGTPFGNGTPTAAGEGAAPPHSGRSAHERVALGGVEAPAAGEQRTEGSFPAGGSGGGARVLAAAARYIQAGVRFDDFGDDAVDNDGDWQPTDRLAAMDPEDEDGRLDDTGADGIVDSGDTEPVSFRDIFDFRYNGKRIHGGERDGKPTPGEPDLDYRDPDERNGDIDGTHYAWASDGVDNDRDGLVDEPDESYMVCVDLVVKSFDEAGARMEEGMRRDAALHPSRYSGGPRDPYLTRRVRNVIAYMKSSADFEYHGVSIDRRGWMRWHPRPPCKPGDAIFFRRKRGYGYHSAIVATVDSRGRPLTVYNISSWGACETDVRDLLDGFRIIGYGRMAGRGE